MTTATLPPPPDMPEGLEHMLPRFAAEMAADTAVLQRLVAAGDAELADHLHAMRGKCAMFGESRMLDVLTRLERIQRGDEPGGEVFFILVEQVIERACQLELYV